MDAPALLEFSQKVFHNLGSIWTFMLLCSRFAGFFTLVPGIGMGERGLLVRAPAMLVFALTAMISSPLAPLPSDAVSMGALLLAEYMFGTVIGMIPMIMVAGVQTGIQLASTTMGLGMGNLMDPMLGIQVSDISRIVGDITIIMFLMLGGHHVVLHAVSGMSGTIVPGSFFVTDFTIDLLIDRTAEIFRFGAILAAPVIVALLLTNFVMGLVTKAVPTVNIFVISFPLTIGIGLILMVLSMPDMSTEIARQITGLENQVAEVVRDTQIVQPPSP